MQRQLNRTIAAGNAQHVASGDSVIKLKLLEFYLVGEEYGGLLTIKEVQDWAQEQGFDKNKVK